MFSNSEKQIFKKYRTIAGIDEVGRGPLAGPVTSAVVAVKNEIPKSLIKLKIKDSKKLSEKQREEIFEIAKYEKDIEYAVSFVNPQVIDKINILEATKLSWRRCLNKLSKKPEYIFIDGNQGLKTKINQETVIGGDSKIWSISLASIIAKVSRDRLMGKMNKKYPEYGFDLHKGYGTKLHLEKLNKFGPTQIHRKSFQPVFNNLSFTDKVYYFVSKIPKGQTMTYKQVAENIGNPKSFRAVGNALNKNRNKWVPCHRVIKSNGQIGGFASGSKRKEEILKREGVTF